MSAAANASTGTLFGVGVGPGDPELLTLKAVRVLAQCPVIAFFRKRSGNANGNAYAAAEPHLPAMRRDLAMIYPVTTEYPVGDARYDDAMTAFYEDQARLIAAELDAGRNVGVLSEGDPFFYGSFMHVFHRLAPRYPTIVVPGVTGMSACWTAATTPISYGDDVLTIIPGTLDADAICARLRATDAAVFMKLGTNFPKVRAAIERCGLTERAIYIERGAMKQQRVMPLAETADAVAPYFAIVIIPGQGRRL